MQEMQIIEIPNYFHCQNYTGISIPFLVIPFLVIQKLFINVYIPLVIVSQKVLDPHEKLGQHKLTTGTAPAL